MVMSRCLRIIVGLVSVLSLLGSACSRVERHEPIPASPQTSAPTVNAAKRVAPGNYVEEITSSNQVRRYRLHVPTNYASGGPLPLVISLHGYNSNAEQQESVSQMSAKAEAVGFIAVYPEGLGNPQSWRFGSSAEGAVDVGFIRDLIQHLQRQWSISPNRIYVTGISNGAEMGYRLACDLSDTIAAVGLVAGGYPPFKDCQPTHPVPAVAFHGTADNLMPYEGRPPVFLPVQEWATSWAARNGCDKTPRVTYQKGEVTGETWSNCHDGADVVLYTITGKGHSWPGSNMPAQITTQDVVATDAIWQFFATHPKR